MKDTSAKTTKGKGQRKRKGSGGEGRLSSAAAPHGALRQLLDEKQTPRGICHAPHTGGGPRMGGSGKPAVWLVFIFTYLVFSAAAAALLRCSRFVCREGLGN